MREIVNTSSSPPPEVGSRITGRLISVPLSHLVPHPANANVMPEAFREKLQHNIEREGDYEPLTVRPHSTLPGYFQILGGHQRYIVLGRLGHATALCYLWPCDDATALLLLTTLNRLEGQDDPLKHAQLLRELAALAPLEELEQWLPEDAGAIRRSLALLDLDLDALLADLQQQAGGSELRAITFAVTAEDERAIEYAVRSVAAGLDGANRRGRALARIVRAHANGGPA
jgi:ParB-like chromosome segregation protein Spo0J